MILKDFSQMFLSKDEIQLLRELEHNNITLSAEDSRRATASTLDRYGLINLYESPTATCINSNGRDYLQWMKRKRKDEIKRWVAWLLSTILALLAVVYSYLNYQYSKNANDGDTLTDHGRGVEDIIVNQDEYEISVSPDPNPPVPEFAP